MNFYLDCVQKFRSGDWSISIDFDAKIGQKTEKNQKFAFSPNNFNPISMVSMKSDDISANISDGNLEVEFTVRIEKMTEFAGKKLRHFDDETAKKYSDVTLVVDGEKFYVLKKFLASHSTYFDTMFLGKFEESEKEEIELKDIDAEQFQNFLELIYGESYVNDNTVEGILYLADFFDAKTAVKKCRDFLLEKSKLPLKRKFEAAIKGNLDDVKRKCLSEMKTKEDVKNVLPQDPAHFHQSVWAELLEKSFSFG